MIRETNTKITFTPEEIQAIIHRHLYDHDSCCDNIRDPKLLNVEYIISPSKKVTDIVVTFEVKE